MVATGLGHVMQLIAEAGVTLLTIHSLHDEMVDAFIQLLEEERSHGFSRILRMEAESDGLSGAPGSRSDQSGPIVGSADLAGFDGRPGPDHDPGIHQ
jgi:hypothetical protein